MTGILDSHVHLWDPDRHSYPWLDSQVSLRRPFHPDDLDPGGHELTGLIVVEAGCRPDHALAEVAWIESLALRWPVIRAMVAQAPLEDGPAAIAALAGRPFVVGVRRNVQDEQPGFMTGAGFVAGVGALAETDLPFDACVREHQLPELAQLVDRNPAVTFVLDHVGKPDIRQRRRAPWFEDLADLARRANVVAKLSGLTTEADKDRWRTAEIRPYLLHSLDVFGPDRCLYGSDWPVATLATTYPRWLELILDTIADLPSGAQTAVLSGTAQRVYRL
jgi:predicted TIM-barrel fold metal-dependent hydrolase